MADHAADRHDVIIVGGGIIGLCTAWYLLREGRRVTVISRDPIGQGASSGNAGMIVPSHVVPLSAPGVISQGLKWMMKRDSPFHLKPRLNLALMDWLLRFRNAATEGHVAYAAPILRDLSLDSVNAFDEMAAELDDFGLGHTGLMMVYRSEKGYRSNMEAADVADGVGLKVRRLSRAEVQELEPGLRSDQTGAVLYEQDGRVDPDALLKNLAGSIRAQGGLIREGVEVRRVSGRSVHLDQDTLQAEDVVVAAGSWTPEVLHTRRLPIQPAKGYSITQKKAPGGPEIPMILSEEKVTITPMPGKIRFGGTLSLAGLDRRIDARRLQPIRDQADMYQHPDDAGRQETWTGFRPCSPDGLPIMGPVPGRPGCWVASGHGMMGVSLGPGTGRFMAALMAGRLDPSVSAPFAPGRFKGQR